MLKIKDMDDVKEIPFSRVGYEDCFLYRGVLYMKLIKNTETLEWNSVCMELADLCKFEDDTLVIPVDATISYTRKRD
jgi:hypothetical protein